MGCAQLRNLPYAVIVILCLARMSAQAKAVTVTDILEVPTKTEVNTNDPESSLWNEITNTNLIDDYQNYLSQYHNGKYVALANSCIKKLQEKESNEGVRKEQQVWQAAIKADTEANYHGYLQAYPQGSYADLARVRIHKLQTDMDILEEQAQWNVVQASDDAMTVHYFIQRYPNSSHIEDALDKLATIRSGFTLMRRTLALEMVELSVEERPSSDVQPNLDNIPDATPVVEPLHRYANRPYTALGKSYTPLDVTGNYKEIGNASWQGKRFHGHLTSIGEVYDMNNMTAAHRTLPIPSYARITNVATRKSVIVRVNDRGPFMKDCIINLSYAAAHKLRIIDNSTIVEVESIAAGH